MSVRRKSLFVFAGVIFLTLFLVLGAPRAYAEEIGGEATAEATSPETPVADLELVASEATTDDTAPVSTEAPTAPAPEMSASEAPAPEAFVNQTDDEASILPIDDALPETVTADEPTDSALSTTEPETPAVEAETEAMPATANQAATDQAATDQTEADQTAAEPKEAKEPEPVTAPATAPTAPLLAARQGGPQDVSAAVTSIAVDKEEAGIWAQINVTVTYAENDQIEFHEGDYITVAWNGAGAHARPQVIDVMTDTGAVIGTLTVTNTDARVVFNAEVDAPNMYGNKGWFSFFLKNLGNTGETTVYTGDEDSPSASTSFTIVDNTPPRKELPDGVGEHRKVGWFEPTRGCTSYGLHFNGLMTDDWATDLVADDTLGPHQTINRASLRLTIATYPYNESDDQVIRGEEEIRNFLQSYGGDLVLNEDGTTLRVVIPQSLLNQRIYARLNFDAFIDEAGLQEEQLTNYAIVNGHHIGTGGAGSGSDEPSEYLVVVNLTTSGADAGHTRLQAGSFKIEKTVEETDAPIAGVEFVLRRADGANVVADGVNAAELVLQTGADGSVLVTGLREGVYLVSETSAPDWVEFTPGAVNFEFTVGANDTEGTLWQVTNRVKQTTVTATKLWELNGQDVTVPTIYFQLYRETADGIVAVGTPVALEPGTTSYVWEELPIADEYGSYFRYFVREVDADGNDAVPEGYNKVEDELTVTNTLVPPTPEEPEEPDTPDTPDTPAKLTPTPDRPQPASTPTVKLSATLPLTGDNAPAWAFIAVLAVLGVCLIGAGFTRRRIRL